MSPKPRSENQQYVQTECTSPTPHVPRRFSVSHRHSRRAHVHAFTHAAFTLTIAVPVPSSVCLSQIRFPQKPCAPRLAITFPLAATHRPHMHNMETAGKPGSRVFVEGRGWMVGVGLGSWRFPASGQNFVPARFYGDKCFTIMMNTSSGDVPCPAGHRMRTLHTCTHTHLKACKHTLNTLMHNKMFLHGLCLARRSSHTQYLSYTYCNTEWKLK